jgi:hypothetical protein
MECSDRGNYVPLCIKLAGKLAHSLIKKNWKYGGFGQIFNLFLFGYYE